MTEKDEEACSPASGSPCFMFGLLAVVNGPQTPLCSFWWWGIPDRTHIQPRAENMLQKTCRHLLISWLMECMALWRAEFCKGRMRREGAGKGKAELPLCSWSVPFPVCYQLYSENQFDSSGYGGQPWVSSSWALFQNIFFWMSAPNLPLLERLSQRIGKSHKFKQQSLSRHCQ